MLTATPATFPSLISHFPVWMPARIGTSVSRMSALIARVALEQAEALARTAVDRAKTETDNIWVQAWTCEDFAAVLERAGRSDDARAALERALAAWERQRCLPCASRVRHQIASLGRPRD